MAHEDLGFTPDNAHDDLGFTPDVLSHTQTATTSQPSMLSRVGNYIAEEGPPIVGSIGGAMAAAPYGAPGGPIGMAAAGLMGGYMGGFAGRLGQREIEQGINQIAPGQFPQRSQADILEQSNQAGKAGALGELIGQGTGKILEAAGPALSKLGGKALQVSTGTPERFGTNLLRNGADVAATDVSKMGSVYSEGVGGLKSLRDTIAEEMPTGEAYAGPAKIERFIRRKFNNAYAASKAGTLTPQDALTGLQASHYLQRINATRPADKAISSLNNVLVEGEDMFRDSLQQSGIDIGAVGKGYFNALTKKAFSSGLPLNKNMSPNALRSFSALAASADAASDLVQGGTPSFAKLFAAPLVSPYVNYLAIRGAQTAAPYLGMGSDVAARAALQSYMDQPRNPAPPLAPR